jgi:hypothetical protein
MNTHDFNFKISNFENELIGKTSSSSHNPSSSANPCYNLLHYFVCTT